MHEVKPKKSAGEALRPPPSIHKRGHQVRTRHLSGSCLWQI